MFYSIFIIEKFFIMNSQIKSMAIRSLLVLFCAGLFSFTSNFGGDSFEVWLNGKRVLQQYVHLSKGIQTLQLANASENDRLDIYYSHCGQTGTDRYITIQDEKNRTLKVWKFTDATAKNVAMSFKLKDILALKKTKTDKLNLVYSSAELPKGRLLATIVPDDGTGIARK
jgi:hypothetical protein